METQFNDLLICEISNQFMADMAELLENDEFYDEYMNIDNILKMEGITE